MFKTHFGRGTYENPCPPNGPAPVPRTGQLESYHELDDGHLKKGVAWPNPRFTDNGNGTVTDNLTGLIWLKNANCFGTETWTEALEDCDSLTAGYCGLTDGSSVGDWRLPNRFELESLLDLKYLDPALCNTAGTGQLTAGDPFNLQGGSYFSSSTTHANIPGYAWGVYMDVGHAYFRDKSVDTENV